VVGKAVGDAKLESDGKADKIEGKVQNAIGGLKDFPICPREQLGDRPTTILVILNDQYAWHHHTADFIGPSFGAISRGILSD